ncbi:MAG: hydrogen peroxide-inducible genes activator, partial [Candidatus Methylopumilus sp.]|nr:hydrogen peroxide-inducible genes activator [Candidatus Methylopumilus sp.]
NIPGIQVLPLYQEEFVVVVPNSHPWVERKYINPKDLSDEKVLLLNSGHCFSLQVVESCPDLSKKGEVLQGNSLETIRNMVASNLGITVLPKSATSDRYQNHLIKVIPFIKPVPSRTIAIAYRKSFVRMIAIEAVSEAIQLIKTDTIKMI